MTDAELISYLTPLYDGCDIQIVSNIITIQYNYILVEQLDKQITIYLIQTNQF